MGIIFLNFFKDPHIRQSIQEWTKESLWKTSFNELEMTWSVKFVKFK